MSLKLEGAAAFAQKFDEDLKRVFSDDNAMQFVKCGTPRGNNPTHGVKGGKLALTG